eukprot:13596871-Ditylum_brightwellii.AAC.1
MFRDLVSKSPGCEHRIKVSLKQITDAAREYDMDNSAVAHTLEPSGFVFHESRCGSTLVANSLAAMNPSAHRVYSESSPPLKALTACGENSSRCPMSTASQLFSDTVYMMSRSNDDAESKVFFKIQSAGSKSISVFSEAFPDTPWIFVYREPNQ